MQEGSTVVLRVRAEKRDSGKPAPGWRFGEGEVVAIAGRKGGWVQGGRRFLSGKSPPTVRLVRICARTSR